MTHPPAGRRCRRPGGRPRPRRVVPAQLLAAHLADFPGGSAAELADFLVGRRALTRFQADHALAGGVRTLALGPYRLTGHHRPGALGPAFDAEKTGRGAPEPVVLVRVPQRSLWRAKQARDLARRAAALRPHPAVVPLVDADSANGFHYLVWAPTFGDRLSDRVAATGPLPPGKVAAVLAQLAAGLAACHVAGLAHGLLSPASVALPTGGAPARVLDIGAGIVLAADLAGGERLLDTATAGRGLAQFLPFAAPEWLAAPGTPTAAADQFSLGAVGYFALTGRPPSPTGDGPVVVPGVNPDLAGVLDRMMATDPADRFSGLDEAHAALLVAADDPDAAGLVAPPSEPAQPTAGTSRGGAVSLGAAPARPADRDDTEDSIRFDLPDATTEPALNGPPATPVSPRPPARAARPAATPPPARRPDPVDSAPPVTLPPRLPAAPLVAPPTPSGGVAASPARAPSVPPPPPVPDPAGSDGWKRLRRKVMFWKASTDTVWVRVYGPRAAARSEAPRVTVFLFPPHAADSVATLARAFDHAAELLGAGVLAREVGRGEELAVHLEVAGVSVTAPLRTVAWHGNPCRAEFDLLVPWEAPAGAAAGVVSVGQGDVRVGKAEFPLVVTADRG